MLKKLEISNLALVKNAQLEFGYGLNVITGETGAGKSILIGAIALALGDRVHPDVVSQKDANVKAFFENENGGLELHRRVKPGGRTRGWINQKSVNISDLKDEGSRWVDLTAQREGISLLDPETHLQHLDRFADLHSLVEKVQEFYTEYQGKRDNLRKLDIKLERMRETEELARFQLDEIERFDPQPGEDKELDIEIKRLEGAESLLIGLGEIIDALDQGENPISDSLAVVSNTLSDLKEIEPQLNTYSESFEATVELLRDQARDLSNIRDDVVLDPERLEELRDRRGQMSRLIRKYGGNLEAVINKRNELENFESGISDLQKEIKSLNNEIENHKKLWEVELQNLSSQREKYAPLLEKELLSGLKTVGIEKPEFNIIWHKADGEKVDFPQSGLKAVNATGWDKIEFHVSFNPGHAIKPIQAVASGGELSRIMLLLKGLHSGDNNPPVLIFDEVDSGISGKVARQVGMRLKELSKQFQVLLVTHLPQIASLADRHIVVEKKISSDSTEVEIKVLPIGSDSQTEEIARLLGGDVVTDSARKAARELITF